ncbi:hypothetical protein FACS1894172_16930 [Spirochaetia bacterium]|nr:hypothetical protein FACS1894164_08980 [Spirochaetia bacterium]GHU35309.1 hypothetical protein FACS1894172_16930 [Spirochaetia bacterium]
MKPENSTEQYRIEDRGPAGGFIFYDKGSYSEGWRYLEAAPNDIGSADWGVSVTSLSGTGTAIGTGDENTNKILNIVGSETGRAAALCATFNINGYNNWFLPSKDELNLMYENLKKKGLGNFTDDWYWSSSEDGNHSHAWGQSFIDGCQGNYTKGECYTGYVRAVRAF